MNLQKLIQSYPTEGSLTIPFIIIIIISLVILFFIYRSTRHAGNVRSLLFYVGRVPVILSMIVVMVVVSYIYTRLYEKEMTVWEQNYNSYIESLPEVKLPVRDYFFDKGTYYLMVSEGEELIVYVPNKVKETDSEESYATYKNVPEIGEAGFSSTKTDITFYISKKDLNKSE